MTKKITISRKYIHLSPLPTETIKDGLWIELKFTPSNTVKPFASTNIIKGQARYEKPNKGTLKKPNYNTVKRAWIENDKKATK